MVSNARRIDVLGGFELEPDAPFGLVDPLSDQAGGDGAVLVAEIVRLGQSHDESPVVCVQLGQRDAGAWIRGNTRIAVPPNGRARRLHL